MVHAEVSNDVSRPDPYRAAARATPATQLQDIDGTRPNMPALRHYRLERVRKELERVDVAGIVLYDPVNIRYATGSRNMAVWTAHNAARYAFVSTDGPVILFEYRNAAHLSDGLEPIDEIRPTTPWYFYGAGLKYLENAKIWAAEIADLVCSHGGGNRRLAIDTATIAGVRALESHGVEVVEGQEAMEFAREIKSPDEIRLMNHAIGVCEAGMAAMEDVLRPGITENQLWAKLHEVNIAHGGEWIETRLLTAGDRTNPWFQESSDRVIRPGELVSYDTDLVGPYGMCADLSRTLFCGPGRPNDEQRRLYRLAWEQIQHNLDQLRPGLTFREASQNAWPIPASCKDLRYGSVYHGVGLCDEFPRVVHADLFDDYGTDGMFRPGMVMCVESYIGEVDGREGVKLEEQVVITETGCELLSHYPFEESLLGREI